MALGEGAAERKFLGRVREKKNKPLTSRQAVEAAEVALPAPKDGALNNGLSETATSRQEPFFS